MRKSIVLIGAILVLASPAIAESCGDAPIAPDIPKASALAGKSTEDAHTFVLASFHSVRAWQGQLSPYRECLQKAANVQKAAAADAKTSGDKAKADAATVQMNALQADYDKTVDTETQVASDFNNLHTAYCKMGDGLTGCPKK